MNTDRPLDPKREVYIDPKVIFVGSLIFGVVFFAIGSFFRYYVWVTV